MPRTIGLIETTAGNIGFDEDAWVALIDSHPLLERPPSRAGINPFTGQPTEFKASSTCGIVICDGERCGIIYSAMDGSPILIVEAEDECEARVVSIAEDVASALGYRFVSQNQST